MSTKRSTVADTAEEDSDGFAASGAAHAIDTRSHSPTRMTVSGAPMPADSHLALVTFGSIEEPDYGGGVRAAWTARMLLRQGVLTTVVSVGLDPRTRTSWSWSEDPNTRPVSLLGVSGRGRWGWLVPLALMARRLSPDLDGFVVESALLGLPVLLAGRPVIWDTSECETLHYQRVERTVGSVTKLRVWHALEGVMARASRVVVAISEEDAEHWRRLFPALRSKLVVCDHVPWIEEHDRDQPPETAYLSWDGVAEPVGRQATGTHLDALERSRNYSGEKGSLDAGPVVLFVGNLMAKHNMNAARWCARRLRQELPTGSTVVLAGHGTSELVAELGHPPGVVGLGFVDGIDRIIERADVCVAPLAAGAGVKTKVIHALALGQRVVGTPLAFEGIRNAPGSIVAELESLPSAVALLLQHPESMEERSNRRSAQRSWAAAQFDTDRLDGQWRGVIRRLQLRAEHLF